MKVSKTARAILVLVGVLLLVPVLGMRLQSTESLEQFHNRVLTRWPETSSFAPDPAGYFSQVNRWFADRVYPIVSATYFKNNLFYFVLDTSPEPNISVARGNFVFLNGDDADSVNDMLENACVKAAEPAMLAAMKAALVELAGFGRRRGLAVDIVLVPTIPTLYGDRLPRAIPSRLREACTAAGPGRSHMAAVPSPEGLHFLDSLAAVGALRDDPAMFPFGNFHPEGLSVKIVRDDYLRTIGAPVPAETATLTSGPSELLSFRGIDATFPIYHVAPDDAVPDRAAADAIQALQVRLYDESSTDYVYRNAKAPDPRTVLMLSDSYGYNAAISFSAAFRTVVQMPAPGRDITPLLDAVGRLMPVDRLVLLFNDSNFIRVIWIADALRAAAAVPNAG